MTLAPADSLETIIRMQSEMQTELGFDLNTTDPEKRITLFKEMKLGLESELQEALDEMGWKMWATSRHFNEDAVFSELRDALQFLLNMFQIACPNIAPKQMAAFIQYEMLIKIEKNKTRQRDGYDGVIGKCRDCKRALDDLNVNCTESENGWYCVETGVHHNTVVS